MGSRALRVWTLAALVTAMAVAETSEMDREILKDLDFFTHMEVVESQEMLEEEAPAEDDSGKEDAND